MAKDGPKGMMQQLQMLQQQLAQTQAQLAEETVEGSAGGGVVKVTITGDQRCKAVEIAPEVFAEGDAEMLQDLILTAINNGVDASRKLAQDKLGPLTGGMGLPF